MKKSLYPTILGILIALSSLATPAPTTFAAAGRATTAHRVSTVNIKTHSSHCYPHCWSAHNQSFHGNSYSHLHETFRGHNLNNTGNQGDNSGRNVNFGANGGNLAANGGRTNRYSSINQHFAGNSYSRDTGYFAGNNLNNSGNQGRNRGYNVDYGSNGGNLIVNHGRSRVNQHFAGNSYSWNRAHFIGNNINNTGNQGWNSGYNEDHGANGGNQIVN